MRLLAWACAPALIISYGLAVWGVGAERWYQPIMVAIENGVEGGDPTVTIHREIRRAFVGEYTVSVWPVPPDGHVSCAGSDRLNYKGGLYRPHTSPLTQWAGDPWCAKLPPGEYFAEACWTILRPFAGLVPAKTTCITSSMFRIAARE